MSDSNCDSVFTWSITRSLCPLITALNHFSGLVLLFLSWCQQLQHRDSWLCRWRWEMPACCVLWIWVTTWNISSAWDYEVFFSGCGSDNILRCVFGMISSFLKHCVNIWQSTSHGSRLYFIFIEGGWLFYLRLWFRVEMTSCKSSSNIQMWWKLILSLKVCLEYFGIVDDLMQ